MSYSKNYTALYVGDLDENVNEEQLFHLFNSVADVLSTHICRDYETEKSLCYGYVNLSNAINAEVARQALNLIQVNGRTIRVAYANRDPTARRSGKANVFIKNLDTTIHDRGLFEVFIWFGNILSCKIATNASGYSKGYGFVQYETEKSAEDAIEALHGMMINDKRVFVGPFMSKKDREADSSSKFKNVYVKNLSYTMSDADLRRIFGEYGDITSAVVMRDQDGTSRGFGFVNYFDEDDAASARDGLDGKTVNGRIWQVRRAQKKIDRELELKELFEQNKMPLLSKPETNLYIKNLDESIGDEQLEKLFCNFGAITSSKVMRNAKGISKGYAFVAYSTKEAADDALDSMKGKLVAGKPLYVAIAQRKEQRRALLKAQFSENRGAPPFPVTQFPMYPVRAPAPRPEVLNIQTFVAHQVLDIQQEPLAQEVRQTGPPFPTFPFFMVPNVPPMPRVPPPPRPAQPPMLFQQMIARGNFHQGPPPFPFPPVQPWPIRTLPPVIASPELQKNMLGDSLFPLVERLVHDKAPKVTGMLLEMELPDLIHLIDRPDALEAKVAEAMAVLAQAEEDNSNSPTDQLASSSH